MSKALQILFSLLIVVGIFQACETIQESAPGGNNTSGMQRGDLMIPGTDTPISSSSTAGQLLQRGHSSCVNMQSAMECMVCNCFNEAGNQDFEGKVRVNRTVLARMASIHFPNTACHVIRQYCQFTWVADGLTASGSPRVCPYRTAVQPVNGDGFRRCYRASLVALERGPSRECFYHGNYVSPDWRNDYRFSGQHGVHTFYEGCYTQRPPGHEERFREEGVDVFAGVFYDNSFKLIYKRPEN